MPSKVRDEITYPFQNYNGCTVEVWKWISNFIPYFIMDAITYPYWDYANKRGHRLVHTTYGGAAPFAAPFPPLAGAGVAARESFSPEREEYVESGRLERVTLIVHNVLNRRDVMISFDELIDWIDIRLINYTICWTVHGSGHETAAVLLPGVAINW